MDIQALLIQMIIKKGLMSLSINEVIERVCCIRKVNFENTYVTFYYSF